jgi:3D (Asp-Asp-Asp) domain-containing protein
MVPRGVAQREARMPKIYVNTDNSNSKAKIYDAAKMGKSAAAAEKKIQEVVTAMVTKEPDFVADKSAVGKGYTVRIKVTKAEVAGGTTTYTVHPEIVRFPSAVGKGGKGEYMVSTTTKDIQIQIQGNSEDMLLGAVEDATQKIMKASFPGMRVDMTNR